MTKFYTRLRILHPREKEVIFFCGRSAILTLDARDDAQEAPDTSMPLCVFESPTS